MPLAGGEIIILHRDRWVKLRMLMLLWIIVTVILGKVAARAKEPKVQIKTAS